jgi:atrial natriuretic peptide receptor A
MFICRFSFATDISRGMKYLHNHKIIHGRLWSSNCMVDDRWSVKITGTVTGNIYIIRNI